MFPASLASAPDWSRRRYSYAVVLGLAVLGLAFPTRAWALLGPPLAVGMVLLGVAHGACDQLVVPASGAPGAVGWRYWGWFLAGYLGLAGVVVALWWCWPAATVGGFFLLTAWHWGSADAPPQPERRTLWAGHSLLRGLLLFAVPAWWWPFETKSVVNELLAFAGAGAVAPAAFARGAAGLGGLVLGGQLVLWAWLTAQRRWGLLQTDLVEALMITGLLMALPPRLSVGVYFVFWHSLQHALRLTGWLGYAPAAGPAQPDPALLPQLAFFLRRAAPLLLLSCAALLALGYWLAPHLPGNVTAWFSLALVVASVVTLPHALLVTLVMDAAWWQDLRGTSRRVPSPGPSTGG